MNTHTRMGYQNTHFDPDRNKLSNMSDSHYNRLMAEWDYNDPVENDERIIENRYTHTDFYYETTARRLATSVQKKAIVDLGYETVTVPAHCWNDETPFAELLFHGYYSASNPCIFIRAVLLDVNVLKSIKPCGTRRNWATGTDFHFWSYDRVQSAILNRFNVEESSW